MFLNSLLSIHYSAFLFTGPFDLAKTRPFTLNQAQESIGTQIIYRVLRMLPIIEV